MKIIVIPVGEAPREATIRDDPRGQLYDLQQIIQGYVTTFHTPRLDRKQNVALVDEDAISKDKEVNHRATLDTGYGGLLFGTVVICGERFRENRETPGDTTKEWCDVHG